MAGYPAEYVVDWIGAEVRELGDNSTNCLANETGDSMEKKPKAKVEENEDTSPVDAVTLKQAEKGHKEATMWY